jgi:hypothetical protein
MEINGQLNPLKTKRKLFHLKTQFVPHSIHFSFSLKKSIYVTEGKSRCLLYYKYNTRKYSVGRM